MLIYDGTDTWDNKAISGGVTIGADGVTVVANDSHTHDTQYYTETELNAGQLDNRYYTETEFASVSQGSAGANLVAVYQSELAHSGSTNVQDVLDDLDAAITTASLTYGVATSVNAAGADFDLVPSTGSSSTVIFAGGTNISITQSTSPETITITNDIDTSTFMTNAVTTIQAIGDDPTTVNAVGANTLKFATGNDIKWVVTGPVSSVITLTPSLTSTFDNYVSWIAKDHDGTTYPVTSGDTLWIKEGTGIDVNFTDDDTLTITNTAPDVNHEQWSGEDTGLNAGIGRTSLGLGTAAVASIGSGSGQVAAGDHSHSSDYLAANHAASNITSLMITDINNLNDDNTTGCTGDQTLPTRASLNIDTDDDVLFDDVRIANNLYLNNYSNSTNNMIRFHHNNSSAYQDWKGGYWYIRHEATTKFRLTSGGQLDCDGDVVAYSTAVSDIRLKDNIEPMKGNLEKLSMLTPISYEYKEKRDGKHLGLSAQEVEEVFPDIVNEMDLMSFGKEGEEYKTVRQQELIPVLIGAIKELKEELEFVKRKVRG
jgi:hypothetical protein